MDPSSALLSALDAVYGAFSGYPRPTRLEASPTRDPAKILSTLSSASLRDLEGEQIGPYSGWVLTTVGSITDYKHFLPRILEQAVRAPEWMGTQPPVIASRLKMAEWRTWPQSEQQAVTALFLAALRDSIHGHPDDGSDASAWLCAVASLGEDLEIVLQEWLNEASGNALLQMAKLATELSSLGSLDPTEQIFWADVEPKVRTSIVAWLLSAPIDANFANSPGIEPNDTWRIEQGTRAIAEYRGASQH
jgi:hypothetical protein